MKILLGYYDKDGRYIGKKLDTSRRKTFYVVLGTIRKKIAERTGQSPYKTHTQIVPYSKNYSDKTRIFLEFDRYENGRKKEIITHIPYSYGNEHNRTRELAKRIREHLNTNIRRMINATGIEMAYFPDGYDLNFNERR